MGNSLNSRGLPVTFLQSHKRWCNETDLLDDADADTVPVLSERDRAIVRNVWTSVFNEIDVDVGLEIFAHILPESAGIRRLFNVEEKISEWQTGRVISHARIVKCALNTFLTTMVDSCGETKRATLATDIRALGARHTRMRPEGFTPEYWLTFANVLVDVTRMWPVAIWDRRRFKVVWRAIVAFLIINMRKGYNDEVAIVEANDGKMLLRAPSQHSLCSRETCETLAPA